VFSGESAILHLNKTLLLHKKSALTAPKITFLSRLRIRYVTFNCQAGEINPALLFANGPALGGIVLCVTDSTATVDCNSIIRRLGKYDLWTFSMDEKPRDRIGRLRADRRPTLSMRLETVGHLERLRSRRKIPIQCIADALIEAGYTSLDEQSKALGLHRSTTWTIVKTKHKLGHLNTTTAQRILANPDTPPSVRAIIQQALVEV